MRKIILIFIIASAHFTLSKSVPVMTLLLMDAGMSHLAVNRVLIKLLVMATKILYFPLLSLALYPRHWFPGYWVNSVILFNSLLWAAGIFCAIAVYRKFRNIA